jgi:uncharacterized glyoxalase superfamily protein PhnB
MPTPHQLIPLLVCQDILAEHDFLTTALGFTSGGVHRSPDGQAVHAEVRAGSRVIWLHRVAPEQHLASPRSLPAAASGLVVYVDDVDAHHQHAITHGAKPEGDPKDMPYGQREYGLTDPEGHRWWFATPSEKP